MMRTLCLFAVLILNISPLWAADYQKGVDAAKQRGDYATTLKEWLPLAKQGHVKAQLGLAELYAKGIGVHRDRAEAFKWYQKASGSSQQALYTVAVMYNDGEGVKQNYSKAFSIFDKLNHDGYRPARTRLAILYALGLGVEQSFKKAAHYLNVTEVDETDEVTVARILGGMYVEGFGVEKDFNEAIKWFTHSAGMGGRRAAQSLGQLYIAENIDKAKGIHWYEKAIELGDVESATILGKLYFSGENIPKDYTKAAKWLAYAVSKPRNWGAFNILGILYAMGEGVPLDYNKSAQLLRVDIKDGNAPLFFKLGELFFDAQIVKKDVKVAAAWYKKSSELGFAKAQYSLGKLRLQNEKKKEAAKWFRLAAEQTHYQAQKELDALRQSGDIDKNEASTAAEKWAVMAEQGSAGALYNLGVLYLTGLGIEKNEAKARSLFLRSADKKYGYAMFWLGLIYAKGLGVEKDYSEAFMWSVLAGNYQVMDGWRLNAQLKRRMTKDQLKDGKKRLEAWFEK